MTYLTFEEYANLGGTLEEAAFVRNIDRCCLMIDNHTHGRFKDFVELPRELKILCRDLVEYISYNVVEKPALSSKSQSAGGVSESESYTVKTADEFASDIDAMLLDYLSQVKTVEGTPVLYRGARA